MKFAHMADCHIGSWRDPKLKDISTEAFIRAVDKCTHEKVDFILIAGDLFNTSLPRIDNLKAVVSKFRELKENNIPVYIIPGSHDYSPSGRTMLDVLEEAGLFVNVVKGEVVNEKLRLKFTVDVKTGAKITGILGKRGGLEKGYYESLETGHLEKEKGYKIFTFHSGIDELKPKDMANIISQPISLLPKGFDYYAGGHVHIVEDRQIEGYGLIAYPGPLFPNSFSELEKLERGGFYIVEDGKAKWEPIQVYNTHKIVLDCTNKSAEQVLEELNNSVKGREFINTIILIRLYGTLASGKPTDIDFRELFSVLQDKGAYFVTKNTNALNTKEFEEIKVDMKSVEDVEERLIREHLGQIKAGIEDETHAVKELMNILLQERPEGMTKPDYEKKIKEEASRILEIDIS